MKTLSSRARRIANLVALTAAFTALCPHATLAETEGPGGPNIPPPVRVLEPTGTTIDANASATQPDGSVTYTTTNIHWTNGTYKISSWANVSQSGVIHFSDGTVGSI